jgi:hypothetical protein
MADYVFIDEQYLKVYTTLTSTVDADLIQPMALLAQDKYITPLTGDSLMEKLKTDAAAGTLSGLYATLVNTYLRKALVWATMVELLPELYVRKDNGAPQIRISDETNQIEQTDLNRDLASYRENMQHYLKRMEEWLCYNGSSMPEYLDNTPPERNPRHGNIYNQSGLTFSSGRRNYSKEDTLGIRIVK